MSKKKTHFIVDIKSMKISYAKHGFNPLPRWNDLTRYVEQLSAS